MNKSAEIRLVLAEMNEGETRQFTGTSHSAVLYAVRSHCRNEIMREILDFDVTSKGGIVTVERRYVDIG